MMDLKDFSGWQISRHINTGFGNEHVRIYVSKWKDHTIECVVQGQKKRYNANGYSKEFDNMGDLVEYLDEKPVVEVLKNQELEVVAEYFYSKKAILKHIELLEKAIENLKNGRLIDSSYNTSKRKIEKIKEYVNNKRSI